MSTGLGGFGLPGTGAIDQTTEAEILWGGDAAKGLAVWKSGVIDGSTRDAGATPTTILRPGLVLGKVTSGGKYKEYLPTATDGTEVAAAILGTELRAQDFNATDTDRSFRLLVRALVKAGQLNGLDQYARMHLARNFVFDDDLLGNTNPFTRVVAKTANYTVLPADNNTLFTTRGAGAAVTFTLPALDRGLRYRFFNEADQDMIVASVATDTMVAFNDLAADSIAFSTTAEQIGGSIEVIANDDETKWLVFVNLGAETQTPTIAT